MSEDYVETTRNVQKVVVRANDVTSSISHNPTGIDSLVRSL